MNKKIYKQPSMMLIGLESNDLLAGSNPSRMRIIDEEVQSQPSGNQDIPAGWGEQW